MNAEKRKEIRDRYDTIVSWNGIITAFSVNDVDAIQRETAKAVIEGIEKMDLGADCPNCNNSGIIPRQISPIEVEAQQCEYCYTFVGSKFDIKDKLTELKKELEK